MSDLRVLLLSMQVQRPATASASIVVLACCPGARRIVVSKAYGLCLGAREHPSSAVSDRGSELLSGATVSSRMAQSRPRCGSAGELLAWRPDRVGHEALMGVTRGPGVAPGLWQGSAACKLQ
jgi:hypothetical protein